MHGETDTRNKAIYTNIVNYIKCLESEYRLNVSVHYFVNIYSIHAKEPPFDILGRCQNHRCGLCELVKKDFLYLSRCLEHQESVFAERTSGVVRRMCWCGVEEYTLPVYREETLIAYICASGYRTDIEEGLRRLHVTADENIFAYSELYGQYMKLDPSPRDEAVLSALLSPVADLMALTYNIEEEKLLGENLMFSRLNGYILENYNKSITVKQLAELFHYSESHISHTFKRCCGMGIRQYVNNLRVSHARELLRDAALSVKDVAGLTGFDDTNYFTSVFKSVTGSAPSEYRAEFIKMRHTNV